MTAESLESALNNMLNSKMSRTVIQLSTQQLSQRSAATRFLKWYLQLKA